MLAVNWKGEVISGIFPKENQELRDKIAMQNSKINTLNMFILQQQNDLIKALKGDKSIKLQEIALLERYKKVIGNQIVQRGMGGVSMPMDFSPEGETHG
jgi:hypothetical protein